MKILVIEGLPKLAIQTVKEHCTASTDGWCECRIGKVMYLYKNGLLLDSFNDMFLLNCDIHSHNTRNKNSFRLPYCKTNVRKFSLRFQGPKIFNSLSSEIHNASSTALFNSKLKSFFLGLSTL